MYYIMLYYSALFNMSKNEAIEKAMLMFKLPEQKEMFDHFVLSETIFNFNVYTYHKDN